MCCRRLGASAVKLDTIGAACRVAAVVGASFVGAAAVACHVAAARFGAVYFVLLLLSDLVLKN